MAACAANGGAASAGGGGSSSGAWGGAVLLEHTPAGERAHVDLLVAPAGVFSEDVRAGRADRDARVVRTWRLDADAAEVLGRGGLVRTATGVALAEHRAHYLDFEGEMSGGRGRVRVLAHGRGRCLGFDGAAGRVLLAVGGFSGLYFVQTVRTGARRCAPGVAVRIERDG